MGLREVSAILWRERHLLELLLFKLDEEQLVLAAGRTRWLPRATREVEMVLEEIRQ
ncbi:MAG TPA: flagellar protein FlgN, partial [Acidimicrobiia bacterium]